MKKYVSLCIPTNGIVEWVIPVLHSIYDQDVDNNLFEVVITDNGDTNDLYNEIQKSFKNNSNLFYYKTTSYQFLNQVECFKKAKGDLIKFVNHRMTLKSNSINILIEFAKKNMIEKPPVYFSNGALKFHCEKELHSFDEFIKELSIYSSWSAGLCIWQNDIKEFEKDYHFNMWFPHTDFLFLKKTEKKYIINNDILLDTIQANSEKKGKYNLFDVFSVEYLALLLRLVCNNYISKKTFVKIKKELFKFLVSNYSQFVICKESCSYDLTNIKESMQIFYGSQGYYLLKIISFFYALRIFLSKIKHKLVKNGEK